LWHISIITKTYLTIELSVPSISVEKALLIGGKPRVKPRINCLTVLRGCVWNVDALVDLVFSQKTSIINFLYLVFLPKFLAGLCVFLHSPLQSLKINKLNKTKKYSYNSILRNLLKTSHW
jgi:hypothetical protein